MASSGTRYQTPTPHDCAFFPSPHHRLHNHLCGSPPLAPTEMPNDQGIILLERDESGTVVARYGQSTGDTRAAVSATGPRE